MNEKGTETLLGDTLAEKRSVVVEALRYIQRFSGTIAVIKYGGAAMIDPELKASFAQDLVLLQSAGLATDHRARRWTRNHPHPGSHGTDQRVLRGSAHHR